MEERDLNEKKATVLYSEAESNVALIAESFRKWNLGEISYATKLRVKSVESQLNKVLDRQSRDDTDYNLESMTDIIGIRAVTLYRQTTLEVLEKFLEMLSAKRHEFNENYKPFEPQLEEAIIYVASNDYSAIANDAKALIRKAMPEVVVKIEGVNTEGSHKKKFTGYSSIHLVTRLKGKSEAIAKSGKFTQDYQIPVEIQIRCAFEDIWGEIDHSVVYGLDQGKSEDSTNGDSPFIRAHIRLLKRLSDTCADYADLIYAERFDKPLSSMTALESISSFDNSWDEDKYFSQTDLPDELKTLYDEIKSISRGLRKSTQLKKDAEQGIHCYKKVIELFPEMSLEKGVLEETSENWPFQYYLNMEYALFETTLRQVQTAFDIYTQLDDKNPGYPVTLFRKAQLTKKLYGASHSIKAYEAADQALSDCQSTSPDELGIKLTKEEETGLMEKLPSYWAYAHWIASKDMEQGPQKNLHMAEALKITKSGLDKLKDEEVCTVQLTNDYLYYVLENKKANPEGKIDQKAVRETIILLEEGTKSEEKYNILHTIMSGYCHLLQDHEKARNVAQKLLPIVTNLLANDHELSQERGDIVKKIVLPDIVNILSGNLCS